jgi:hypothetical protein
MQDLQSACVVCPERQRCERDLERGYVRATYGAFCPNAAHLDTLRRERLSGAEAQA